MDRCAQLHGPFVKYVPKLIAGSSFSMESRVLEVVVPPRDG
jgi:hypothetical protein